MSKTEHMLQKKAKKDAKLAEKRKAEANKVVEALKLEEELIKEELFARKLSLFLFFYFFIQHL